MNNLNSETLYYQWLAGLSLRKLAHQYGVSHSTIKNHIQKAYGRDATDPVRNSLVRSLSQDYPDFSVAYWLRMCHGHETIHHRSGHNMSQLTKHQTARKLVTDSDTVCDRLAWYDPGMELDREPNPVFLRLTLFAYVFRSILDILEVSMCDPETV